MSNVYFTLLILFNKEYDWHSSLKTREHGYFIVRLNSVISSYMIILRVTLLTIKKTAHYTINITWQQE